MTVLLSVCIIYGFLCACSAFISCNNNYYHIRPCYYVVEYLMLLSITLHGAAPTSQGKLMTIILLKVKVHWTLYNKLSVWRLDWTRLRVSERTRTYMHVDYNYYRALWIGRLIPSARDDYVYNNTYYTE